MGEIRTSDEKVRLFFGLLAGSTEELEMAVSRLALDFSPVESRSPVQPFTHSDYYAGEMGTGLLRQWVATRDPIFVTELPSIKIHTNRLEKLFAREGRRRINLDPGFVSTAKVVLATTKDHAHRIYVADGIFEEVTLRYTRPHGFEPWPWTYQDYRTPGALEFFAQLRKSLPHGTKHTD